MEVRTAEIHLDAVIRPLSEMLILASSYRGTVCRGLTRATLGFNTHGGMGVTESPMFQWAHGSTGP